MCFFFILTALAAADQTELVTIPLPDAPASALSEASPWQAPTEEHAAPPVAWTQIGDHAVGDKHRLYDASGEIALDCEIRAFELRGSELGAWESVDVEVWAHLECGREELATR